MIEPDTKDRTWVLERRCAECGYDAATLARGQVAPAVRDSAACWPSVLARGPRSSTALTCATWRRGRRSDGASFTVDSFSRYFVHDLVHHRQDVRG